MGSKALISNLECCLGQEGILNKIILCQGKEDTSHKWSAINLMGALVILIGHCKMDGLGTEKKEKKGEKKFIWLFGIDIK